MKISDIEKVLLEQQDELEALEGEVLIQRPEEDLINLNSKLAQVVIGVRRSGKSTLCFNALRKAGVHYAFSVFFQSISDTWRRPSLPGRISTNAPNSRIETTLP